MGRSAPAIGGTGVKALSEPCRTTIDQFSSSSPWGHHYRFPRTPGGGSLSSWSNEAITYGGLVADQRQPGGISLQLLPKAAHRNAQIVDVVLLLQSPQDAQPVGMGEAVAGVLGQLVGYHICLRQPIHPTPPSGHGDGV